MIGYSSVNIKGQITIPSEIRKKIGVKHQDRVVVTKEDDKIVVRLLPDIKQLRGSVPNIKPMNIEKMEEEFAEYMGTRRFR